MKLIFTLLFILSFTKVFSQDINKQFNDFNFAIATGKSKEALALADKMNVETSNLSNRKKAIVFFKVATYFEKNKMDGEQTISYYEKSLKYEPNYYVPHLALGYLFLNKANDMVVKINNEKSNLNLRNKYVAEYKTILKQSLPHFEKAMACDPNDQVLNSIKNVYLALKDTESIKRLDAKLSVLNKDCIDFLSED